MDNLLKDLKDLILCLKDKSRFENKDFQKNWDKRFKSVENRLTNLSEEDYNKFSKMYEEWFKNLE